MIFTRFIHCFLAPSLLLLLLVVISVSSSSKRFFNYHDWNPIIHDPDAWLNSREKNPNSIDPFSTLSKAVHDTMRNMGMYFPDLTDPMRAYPSNRLPPGVYARESDTERLFFIDLPGFHRSNVRVELVRGHIVSVHAERKCDKDDVYCISRAVQQDFVIDEDIDINKITVNLDAGELRIHLPKRTATRFNIPIVDHLLGLNQPSHDRVGDKLPVHAVKSTSSDSSPGSDKDSDAIHWPSMIAGANDHEEHQRYLDVMRDAAGRVAEGAEAVRERSKHQASQWMDQVHQAAERTGDSVQHVWNAASDKAEEMGEAVRCKAKCATENAQQRVQDLSQEARQSTERVGSKINNAAEIVRDSTKDHVIDPMMETAHEASDRVKHAADDVKQKTGGLLGWFGDMAAGVKEATHHCVDCVEQGYEEGKAKHHEQKHHNM